VGGQGGRGPHLFQQILELVLHLGRELKLGEVVKGPEGERVHEAEEEEPLRMHEGGRTSAVRTDTVR
jgi:hypothetical protein